MRKKLYLVIALLVALAVTVGTFTYTQTSATTGPTISKVGVDGAFATVSTTKPIDFTGYATNESPNWSPSVDTAGNITEGDIYYIDVGTYTGDILVTIYLNNPAALLKDYSFLNMAICAYGATYNDTETTWSWGKPIGSPITQFKTTEGYYTCYLTLTNGYVSFILKAGETTDDGTNSYFAITIEGGSYYCISTTAGDLSPDFYIDIRQA